MSSRRQFLKTIGTAAGGLLFVRRGTATAGSQSITPPTIPKDVLSDVGWEARARSSLPTVDRDDIKAKYGCFYDIARRRQISEQTNGRIDTDFHFIWAMKATPTKAELKDDWTTVSEHGEPAESIVSIDGYAEEVYEAVQFENVFGGALRNRGPEVHRKATWFFIDYGIQQIPWVGEPMVIALDWTTDKASTLQTATGDSAYFVEYFLDRPITSEQEGISDDLDSELWDISVDYRGWHADWFHDGQFYSVGGVHPDERSELQSQLNDALGEELVNLQGERTFQEELMYLLRNIT